MSKMIGVGASPIIKVSLCLVLTKYESEFRLSNSASVSMKLDEMPEVYIIAPIAEQRRYVETLVERLAASPGPWHLQMIQFSARERLHFAGPQIHFVQKPDVAALHSKVEEVMTKQLSWHEGQKTV